MEEKNKITVGQVLYRDQGNGKYSEYVVTKVGKKYFYCDNRDTPYSISELKYLNKTYSQCSYQLFIEKESIINNFRRCHLLNNISKMFSFHHGNLSSKISLEKLEEIAEILDIK